MSVVVEKPRRGPRGLTPRQRFWRYVAVRESGCWEWLAAVRRDGYGALNIDNKCVPMHRFSWEMFNGGIPHGLCVLHRCDNRKCVNPAHLFLGTKADNTADMMSKGRHWSIPHLGVENGNSVLNEKSVLEIRASSASPNKLARRFGVGRTTIRHILSGRTWRHLQ